MNICFVLGLGYRWFGCRHKTEKKGIVFNIFFVVLMDFTMTKTLPRVTKAGYPQLYKCAQQVFPGVAEL